MALVTLPVLPPPHQCQSVPWSPSGAAIATAMARSLGPGPGVCGYSGKEGRNVTPSCLANYALVNEPWPSLPWHSQDRAVTRPWEEMRGQETPVEMVTVVTMAPTTPGTAQTTLAPAHIWHRSSERAFLTQNKAPAQVRAGDCVVVWQCRAWHFHCRLRMLLILQICLFCGGKAAPAPGAASAQAGW